MSKKMLVDASHPEETRVVVLSGNRVEEFDYENADRVQLKGNIYLAKVTRVEPSLQACFVEYGGNRHGFLPFSEIHPDYYQIPVADRRALMEANRAASRSSADDEEEDDEAPQHQESASTEHDDRENGDHAAENAQWAGASHNHEMSTDDHGHEGHDRFEHGTDEQGKTAYPAERSDNGDDDILGTGPQPEMSPMDIDAPHQSFVSSEGPAYEGDRETEGSGDGPSSGVVESIEIALPPEDIETIGAEDALDEVPNRDPRYSRRYKIQEVIKRRQILLIQVVKEERGNKGAAVTTFLSLAGRYCVLMPNTDRGGGVSRKIANPSDRRKLKELASELDVPEGMGVIIRTAGANRTKQEIKRDFEYLLREWDAVRELTLRSSAPALVYEEGSLIKRAIRDLYNKDIDEILVEGEHGGAEAREFMRLLMPTHANQVRPYKERLPLFQAYGVEAQLDSMFSPTVRLRSGGYIVINQTEALVAVDVNSGKATREHNIEDTALKTNIEAAEEIARQLRLRDLAGLIVIDFIDMEEGRNNRHVEKRLKDALKHDRARIQVGRISPFGLMEMSRQRLRSGMVEGSTVPCPHCEGRGIIRSVGSMALRVLRAVEEYCQRQQMPALTLRLPPEIAIYILNHKRAQLSDIEDRHNVYIYIEAKTSLTASSYEVEHGAPVSLEPRRKRKSPSATSAAISFESVLDTPIDADEEGEETEASAETGTMAEAETGAGEERAPSGTNGESAEDERNRRRKRRRRGGRGRDRDRDPDGASPPAARADTDEQAPAQADEQVAPSRPRPATPQPPRPAAPRLSGIPSPAEFSFGPHDLPDTSPDAFDTPLRGYSPPADDDGDMGDDAQSDATDAASANAPQGETEEQRERRRSRRGRRGRRGRFGDRRDDDGRPPRQDRPPHQDREQTASPAQANANGPSPERVAGDVQDPRGAMGPIPIGPVRPEPQFSLGVETPRQEGSRREGPRHAAPDRNASRAPQEDIAEAKTEPKQEWSLASFFGLGPKPAPSSATPSPIAPSPAAPSPAAAAPVARPEAREEIAEPTPAPAPAPAPTPLPSNQPARKGWWQKRDGE